MDGSRRRAAFMLLAALGATVTTWGLIRFGEIAGMRGAKPLAELAVGLVLLKVFQERNTAPWTARQLILLPVIGLALGLLWVALFAWGRTAFPSLDQVDTITIVMSVVSPVITAPICEEKIVRHLLLESASMWVTRWVAVLGVSIVFAVVHREATIWSFLVSLFLCWLAVGPRLGTLQRAVVHGVLNAVILAWFFTTGFGFFRPGDLALQP